MKSRPHRCQDKRFKHLANWFVNNYVQYKNDSIFLAYVNNNAAHASGWKEMTFQHTYISELGQTPIFSS